MTRRKPSRRTDLAILPAKEPLALLAAVRKLIVESRGLVARTVNSGLTLLCWQIGSRIRTDILREKLAWYGEQIVSALGTQMSTEFGRGFSRRYLFNMVRFAKVFLYPRIVQPLAAQLSGSYLTEVHDDRSPFPGEHR